MAGLLRHPNHWIRYPVLFWDVPRWQVCLDTTILSISGYPILSWDVPRWQICLDTPIIRYLVSQDTQYYSWISTDGRSAKIQQYLVSQDTQGCPQMAGLLRHPNHWIRYPVLFWDVPRWQVCLDTTILSISGYPILSWDVPRWQICLDTPIIRYLVSQDTQYYSWISTDGRSA